MRDNLTLLIMSCGKFSDLWDGQVKLLEKNWPDRECETKIVTDVQCDREFDHVSIFSAGEKLEWSERLRLVLEQVETEYVFLTLDDYFLIKRVVNSEIDELLSIMEKYQLDYIRLFPRPKAATKEIFNNYKGIRKIDIGYNYSVNLTAGIWKKDFLQATIHSPMNAWQFEVALHKCAEEYGAKCVVSLRNEYKILDVVRKGKLLHRAKAYFRHHQDIYNGNRETNTWNYEINLTIQQLFARHLPPLIKQRVKAYMTKRGHVYYSDQINK